MILHELTANMDSFRPVKFVEGLNVVLAKKAETSGKKDTRNGVGKTTLIEILMFCLGGQATQGKGIVQEALRPWEFTLDMTLKGKRIQVSRAVSTPDLVLVRGEVDAWPVKPSFEYLGGIHVYEVSQWLDLLGWALFDLFPFDPDAPDHPVAKGMLSCFIRLGHPAYRRVNSHSMSRKAGKESINLAYLLRLDWEFIGKIKQLYEDLDGMRAAKEVLEEGVFSTTVGKVEEIRVKQTKVQAEIAELERSLRSYNFVPQYNRLQDEVNTLTEETLSLSNRIAAGKRRLATFQRAIREEHDAMPEEIAKLYQEAGFAFPSNLLKTLQDVQAFHKQIVQNRKNFLDDEIMRLNEAIQALTAERDEKSRIKGEKTAQLATQDVFAEVMKYRDQLAELKSLDKRYDEAIDGLEGLGRQMASTEKEIEEEKSAARKDFNERRRVLAPMLKDFSSFTDILYGKPGKLSIVPENGDYSFGVEMEKGGSDGVRLMGIFCFDLGLLKAQHRFEREMKLLVHDTPIFDAVDDRQRALALELAARETLAMHGQYICTMNSDKVPREHFSEQFDFDSHVIHVLSDSSPSASLLGIHFEVDS